jgi:pyruvate formate-lyase/glycerol dehydratase family glycyl radical enzyme
MTINLGDKKIQDIGSWQQYFVPNLSERIQKAKKRITGRSLEICLDRARAEMKAFEQYKNEPRIIQRAHLFETFLKEKTVSILEDELIVGNMTSKYRAAPISGETMAAFLDEELDDPVKDPSIRPYDSFKFSPEERKELRQVILPYFKGKTYGDYAIGKVDEELKEKAFMGLSSCPHIPNLGDVSLSRDPGHQMVNYEKVLYKGLKGIRDEVLWYMAHLDQPYVHFGTEEKRDFYRAALISVDAAIAFSKRYVAKAREMALKEADPKRKKELERIAAVCEQVPENPARDWWEALQSVWMMHILVYGELQSGVNCFARFDQYMYPFYKKSVIDDKAMSREEALELLECFWIKTNEHAWLLSYLNSQYTVGQGLSQALVLGGQTRDGKDGCNEVTFLCLEADEQLSVIQPETALRLWEGTPDKYLRKAAEVIRLGRGKPKFIGDRKGIKMMAKAYPDLNIKDWREYAIMGCTEVQLPHITMGHLYEGNINVAKLLELVLHNGKCSVCGKQIGPQTGDPKSFESMAAVRQAYREQVFYWMKYLAKGIKVLKEIQASQLPAPFASTLAEGPLQKGTDIFSGGTWYTLYGLLLNGLANTADSLAVIDKLIYIDKKITWDQLLEAIRANWKGYENLRQLCINRVPKYGNDNDYADGWAAWVMDTWYDSVDWINTQKELIPYWGGKYVGATNVGTTNVMFGELTGALPEGHIYPKPLADTLSPVQGMDKNGPTAVIKSVSKLPSHRFANGGILNIRLSPQLVATERDLDNFVSFLRAVEELGLYHVQFNVITTDLLRKAMKEPENYKDLLVRVASFVSYFVELAEVTQLDIINRTEQQGW